MTLKYTWKRKGWIIKYFGIAKTLLESGKATKIDSFNDNKLYDSTIKFSDDLNFYKELANKNKGRILDIGCGTGRVMIPLLKEGYNVIGLDNSKDMIMRLKKKLDCEDLNTKLIISNMKDFNIEMKFSLIIIPYFTMIYLHTKNERKKVFNNVYKHLKNDGTLAFDFDAGKSKIGISQPWLSLQKYDEKTNTIYIHNAQMKGITRRKRLMNIIEYRIKENMNTDIYVKSILESSVSAKEIKNLLKNCGFSIKGIYKNYNYDEYLSGDTAVVVAKKK